MRRILPNQTIGIIGGGQLGKMLAISANTMGYKTVVLDPNSDSPGFTVANQSIIAPYEDRDALQKLCDLTDVITYEFENISANAINWLIEQGAYVPQGANPLYLTQNRGREKSAIIDADLPYLETLQFASLTDNDLDNIASTIGYPFVIKTQEGGYDGKGQAIIHSDNELDRIIPFYGCAVVIETFITFDYEASIIGVRGLDNAFKTFPVAKNLHINHILHESFVANDLISDDLKQRLHDALQKFMQYHKLYGILAMEVFVKGDDFFVNEFAPRPHNSGHYTIEGCVTSQFDQLIRAICCLPLGDTTLKATTTMFNLLGQHMQDLYAYLPQLSSNAHLHLYGKSEAKDNRKMGHVTFTGTDGIDSFIDHLFTSHNTKKD